MTIRCAVLALGMWVFGCAGSPAVDGGTGGGSAMGGGGGSVDATPPGVLDTTPSSGASSVSVSTPVVVRFGEAMDVATVTVTTSPATTLGSPTWNASGTEVQLTPTQPLAFSAAYSVTVAGADLAGNKLPAFSFSFTTAAQPDTTPPTVLGAVPSSGATQVADTTPLTLQFSEAMLRSSVSVTASPALTFGEPVFTNNDASWSIAPATRWATNTAYTVTVTGTDLSGNALAPAYVFTFTTGGPPDTTPPTLTGSSPMSGAMNVPTNTRLALAFSEPIDPSSLAVGTTPPIALGTPTFGNGDALVTFLQPSADWAPSTAYTVTVEGADLRGNALPATSFSFTSSGAPDTVRPFVQASTPGASMTAVPTNARVELVFSEPMNVSATQAAVSVSGGVTCAFAWRAADTILSCTPSAALAPSTTFTVTVGTGAADVVGNTVATSYSFSFTTGTGSDTVAPTVVSTTPTTTAGLASPGTVGVPQSTTSITVRFSEAMDKASAQAAFVVAAPSTTNGAFTWDPTGTELTYTFSPSFSVPFGAVFEFSIANTATDLAGNALGSSGSRFFRVRRQSSLALYACGTNQNCAISSPMAQPGTILAPNTCTGTVTATPGGSSLTVGDSADNRVYRSFASFDMRPLDDAAAYPNLSIDRAVLSVYQEACAGSPYSANVTTFMSRQAVAFAVNYGTAVDASDCAIPAAGAHPFTLPSNTSTGVAKSSTVTTTFTTQWNERAARSFRAQYMLRVNLDSDADGMLDLCTFASHGSNIATQRPSLGVTFQYD